MSKFYNRNWRMPNSFNGSEDNNSKFSNYSMSFDGSSEFINLGTSIPPRFSSTGDGNTEPWSVSLWANFTTGSEEPLIQFPYGVSINTWYLFHNTKISFGHRDSSALCTETNSTAINSNQWNHIVVAFDGVDITNISSFKLYINAVNISISTRNHFGRNNTNAINIGRGFTSLYYDGKLDHVALFDYALTDGTGGTTNQIAELYGSTSTGVGNPMAITNGRKPVAYYPIGDYSAYNGTEYLVPNSAVSDYVFNFNTQDYVEYSHVSINGAFTVSTWVKTTDTSTYGNLFSSSNQFGGGPNIFNNWKLIRWSRSARFNASNSSNSIIFDVNTGTSGTRPNLYDGNWHHVLAIWDGTTNSNGVKIFFDGVLRGLGAASSTAINTDSSIPIRAGSSSAAYNFIGEQSNQQIWNTALTYGIASADGDIAGGEVATIYNNGTPLSDMSGFTSLQGWWKLDASATFDGSNWSIEDSSSNSNTGTSSGMTAANLVQSNLNILSPYSRYSLDFDGTGDKITLNSSVSTGNNYSVSLWLNPENVSSGNSYLFSDSTTSPFKGLALDQGSSTAGGFGNFYYYTGAVTIVNNTAILGDVWSHIVISFNITGQEIKFYVNGVLDKTSTSVANISSSINEFGIRSTGNAYNGKLSNPSIWNTALTSAQVTEIYNNGLPSNLKNHSSYSNLVSWWTLGENSSFNSNWTVIDEKGTNNGTSSGMAEDDLVNGVGTSGNGLSSGMGGADNILGEAPYSTSNALSYGMGADAKSTSVPS